MALTINTSLSSMGAQRNAGRSQNDLSTAIARLSSGLRINTARDDAAGLAISDRFSAQIRGTQQAGRNANDAISLSQTAEGGLAAVSDNLQRVRELAVQAANATNSPADRAALQTEVVQLTAEIDRVARQAEFNGLKLLDGSFVQGSFQVGANRGQAVVIDPIDSARSASLGRYRGVTLTEQPIGPPSTTLAHRRTLTVTLGGVSQNLGNVLPEARAIAAAINASGIQGLSAQANPTRVPAYTSTAYATQSGTAEYTLNEVVIPIPGLVGSGNLAANRAAAVAAINAYTAQTGVVATDVGTGVDLAAPDGRNITTNWWSGTFTNGTPMDFGVPAPAVAGSTVNVTYVAPADMSGSLSFQQDSVSGPNLGFTNSTAIGLTGAAVAGVDVSTAASASAALATLDRALASVSTTRAGLGAMQTRFLSALTMAEQTGENLSAARSRILDADFAFETANLTRAQILQQAGTAMTLQANQRAGDVLSLLR